MKNNRKNLISISLAIFASFLFYKQGIGLNIFIFTFASALVLLMFNSKEKEKLIFKAIIPAITTSVMIIIYPQSLSYLLWLFSYLIMWSLLQFTRFPIVVFLQGLVSISLSPKEVFNKLKLYFENEKVSKNKLGIYLITFLIVTLFSFLYISSNPIFSDIFFSLDFSFIEFWFIIMSIVLYLLLFGLITIKTNKKIRVLNTLKEMISEKTLSKNDEKEFEIAKISIWILGFILLVANISDIIILFSGALPEGMTYSKFVHQGFNTLIFTLSLAIGLVIYFFRGQLNFHKNLSLLKKASFFWIIQNLVLALITIYKNYLYIEVYGFTYKRIALFLGLVCVIIALILSIYKIRKPFTNWFYFNKLSFFGYASLLFISFIPFDIVITHFNLKKSEIVDINYLLKLSKPDLFLLEEYISNDNRLYNNYFSEFEEKKMIHKENSKSVSWKSWNLYLEYY